jgi:hypothetical protein
MSNTELWARRLERARRAQKEAETLLESTSYELYLDHEVLRTLYDTIDLETCSVSGLIAEMVTTMQPLLERNDNRLEVYGADTGDLMHADPDTLDASGYLTQPIDPERLIMTLQSSIHPVLPAPIAVEADDSLPAGPEQSSHERGYV